MSGYPVSLAVEDFVPVALTVAGVWLLSGADGVARRPARAAAVLLAAGGFAKAGWKLTVALDGPDLRFFYNALFPLLAAGFLLLVHAVASRRTAERALWGGGAALAAAYVLCAVVRGTWPALVLAVAAATVAAALLARRAPLVLLWLAGEYALGPLAARPDQSTGLQWIEQSCNTLTQAVLVYTAWRLVSKQRQEAFRDRRAGVAP